MEEISLLRPPPPPLPDGMADFSSMRSFFTSACCEADVEVIVDSALHNFVAMRGGGGKVVEVGVEVLCETDAGHADVGEVGDGLAARGVRGVVDGLGGGCRAKSVFVLCDASFAFEVLMEGFEESLTRGPRLVCLEFAVPGGAIVGK